MQISPEVYKQLHASAYCCSPLPGRIVIHKTRKLRNPGA